MRRFVADVSHELRTPLAAVTAYTELFERGARDQPDDLERALRGISLEAGRMGELVEELLLLAHLDEGRPLDWRRVDLVEVVVDAIAAARAVSPEWPITLRVTDVVDGRRRRQPTAPGDGQPARQRAHAHATGDVDVGRGRCAGRMGHDRRRRRRTRHDRASRRLVCFERFFHADPSRSRQSGGAGLGMAIVEALVAAHGGHIALDTSPGRGVRITVSLPLPTPATATAPPVRPTRSRGRADGRVVVVPDPGERHRRHGPRRRVARVRRVLLGAQHRQPTDTGMVARPAQLPGRPGADLHRGAPVGLGVWTRTRASASCRC